MKPSINRLLYVAICAAIVGLLSVSPAISQQAIRIYGTVTGGASKPIAVDSSGSMAISLSGGGASTSAITVQRDDIRNISTDGFIATNTTLATAGIPVQRTPRLRFAGNVWNTTAVAASNTDEWYIDGQPQSSATPGSGLNICSIRNGGTAICAAFQTSAIANFFLSFPATGLMTWSGLGGLSMPAGGQVDTFDANGTTNAGMRFLYVVEPNTTTKTPTARENNEAYTNTGDADGSAITLPDDPAIGSVYHAMVTVAQTITITKNTGETLKFGTSTCGTSLTSNAVGSAVTIVAATGGSGAMWITTASTGTWTCNP